MYLLPGWEEKEENYKNWEVLGLGISQWNKTNMGEYLSATCSVSVWYVILNYSCVCQDGRRDMVCSGLYIFIFWSTFHMVSDDTFYVSSLCGLLQMRNAKEVEKDDYHEFYKKTFNEFLDPLAYTHFTTEVPKCFKVNCLTTDLVRVCELHFKTFCRGRLSLEVFYIFLAWGLWTMRK